MSVPFFMYEGTAFPTPDALLSCRGVKRLAPLDEPMAQFYAEIGLHRSLAAHPMRVHDPSQAQLFYVPVLPHLDQDAGGCNGTGHRARMSAVAAALRASPHWRRSNGTDHFWACTCVMMRSMLTNELWSLLTNAVHAVHSVPRNKASPSRCQLAIPYFNPAFASTPEAASWRDVGRARPVLAHFRGRVMNRVRAALVKNYGGRPGHVIEAAHPSTAARCNLNKCSAKALAKASMPSQREHVAEMARSTFCLVPVGDSPPSSRLYLALAAGCVPVLLSDHFEGAFAPHVPWRDFTLRFAEATVAHARGARRGGATTEQPAPLNLTAELQAVAADTPRLHAMQASLKAHAADVLWEAAGSRVGTHTLNLASYAIRRVCVDRGQPVEAAASPAPPGAQVTFAVVDPA